MAQNYRNQSGRSDYGRGERYQTGSERDRYRTGGEQRFNPEWDERNDRGFEGDRSYSGGGYSEEFGHRRGQNRDESNRDHRSGNYQSRGSSGANYQSHRSDYGREGQSRYDEGRFDEGNRWSEGASGNEDNASDFLNRGRTQTSSWHEDQGDRGGYFQTGNYVDDGGAGRGLSEDFYRAREQQMRYGGGSRGGTSGDYQNYGKSYYGSQSSYGRDYGNAQRDATREQQRPWRGQSQQGGSQGTQWGGGSSSRYGAQQGGFGGTSSWDRSGTYGSDYGSYARAQSFRGRGPQGYQRSDDRLKEIICERLTDDPAIDASNVTIEVTGQVVKLTGTVDDRSTKYEIEELIESFGGVKDIDNQLRVQSSQSSSTQGGQTGQQLRGGSDWEAGSSSLASSGTTTTGRTGTTSGSSSTTSGGSTSTKRN